MSKGLTITNIEIIVDLRLSAPNGEEWVVTKAWGNDGCYYIELRMVGTLPLENIVILRRFISTLIPNQPKEYRTYTLQGINGILELPLSYISDKYKLLQAICKVTFED